MPIYLGDAGGRGVGGHRHALFAGHRDAVRTAAAVSFVRPDARTVCARPSRRLPQPLCRLLCADARRRGDRPRPAWRARRGGPGQTWRVCVKALGFPRRGADDDWLLDGDEEPRTGASALVGKHPSRKASVSLYSGRIIDRDEIKAKSSEFDIHHANVEHDYVFGWLLKSIFENGVTPPSSGLQGAIV